MSETTLRKTTWAVRYGVPAALEVAGVIILAATQSTTGLEGWGMFTGAAGAVLLLNQLYRVGARGDVERDEEEWAREYYDAHGEWPRTAAAGGRRWTLPAGAVTLEAEEAAARQAVAGERPAGGGAPATGRGQRPTGDGAPAPGGGQPPVA